MDYCTIRHRDTNKPLGMGGPLDRGKALSIIRSRARGDDGKPFASSEWIITGWTGNGGDDDEIEFQMSADEFSHVDGRP
ncbi:MAG TPA: hypothetical protein VFL96_04105 [Acidobacteriaceae bacterium]|nr:hypothetical protein [Acidobacteriaceae bacterium]